MIELTFGEGAAGGLQLAKSMKRGERLNGPVASIGDRPPMEYWPGETLPGSPGEVLPLSLALDIGDISEIDDALSARRAVLDALYGDYEGVPEEMIQASRAALRRLRRAGKEGEPVRIWAFESDPTEACGLCFACDLLRDESAPLSVVRIPHYGGAKDAARAYFSAGEIEPEMFGSLARYEQTLECAEKRARADAWRALARQNAPLRAVVNGKAMGVPEDFYDFALRKNIPDGPFKMALLLGKTLLCVPGVGDRWLYLRALQMIRAGELVELEPAEPDSPYSATLSRA